jgi:invasion protein IalB
MPKISWKTLLFTASVLLYGAGNAATAQQPAGAVRSTHGAWSIICDTPAGAMSEQCALIQPVVSEKRPDISLSVIVLRTADNKAIILRLIAPLGVVVRPGVGLRIDDEEIGSAPYLRCLQDGCWSDVILDDALIGKLEKGKTAYFFIFPTLEEGIAFPVDLTGFGEGFAALP